MFAQHYNKQYKIKSSRGEDKTWCWKDTLEYVIDSVLCSSEMFWALEHKMSMNPGAEAMG